MARGSGGKSGRIHMNVERLDAMATDIENNSKKMFSAYRDFLKNARSIADGVWAGEAREEYKRKLDVFDKRMTSYEKVIKDYIAALRKAADMQRENEKKQTQNVSGLMGGRSS